MANPFINATNAASPQSIYSTYTTQEHRLGTLGHLDDRTFRYVRFLDTTAIGPNKLAQQAPPVANHVTQTITLAGSGFDVANSTSVTLATIGGTAMGQDEYKDGYIKVQSATNGTGQTYKIRGNSFTAASGTPTLQLYDPVVTAVTGTLVISLVHNPWGNVVIQPTTITAPAAGVTNVSFAACTTASVSTVGYLQTATTTWTQPQYGWLQTRGYASCLLDTSALVAGSDVIAGGVTAGAIGVDTAAGVVTRIGTSLEALTGPSKYASIFLKID